MKTIQEMIAVMQAYEDGKEIELRRLADSKYYDCKNPSWNWDNYDYRVKVVKEAPEYIPFTFEDADFLIGKAIKKDGGHVYSILGVQNSGVTVIHPIYKIVSYTWEDLIRGFKFFPGNTLCGKLKQ